MPLVVSDWLAEHVDIPAGVTSHDLAAALVRVGLEEEAIHPPAVTGNLVVGQVVTMAPEPQKNGKTINWCRVDVGPTHNEPGQPAASDTGEDIPAGRGIVCGAHNFAPGDLVVVALPGTVLPGPFPIAARKTYGHVSDGMICSAAELGLGDDGSQGIIVLGRDLPVDTASLAPGDDAIALLGLGDEVLEINVTPDRGYALSYRGVAREYALATGARFTDRGSLAGAAVPSGLSPAAPSPAAHAQGVEGTQGLEGARGFEGTEGFEVRVDDFAPLGGQVGCDRFVTRIVRGIDPLAVTPAWMKRRLEASGMRSISLTVDITNYVMLDLGQPLHAYDLDTVAAPIVVRRARAGERLTTLDGVDRLLDVEDLVITDSPGSGAGVDAGTATGVDTVAGPSAGTSGAGAGGADADGGQEAALGSRLLGIAGVMGGAASEVTQTTTAVLIEAAHFDPISVARTSRRHKLSSEAAKRFERGVDPQLPAVAVQKVVDLLVEFAGGQADSAVRDLNTVPAAQPLLMPANLPSRIVGVAYSSEQVVDILQSIGCQVELEAAASQPAAASAETRPADGIAVDGNVADGNVTGAGSAILRVTPPSWRPDLTEPVALVEEVARIAGYDQIPSQLPQAPGGRGLSAHQRARRSVARALAEAGLVETLSYPFVGTGDLDALGLEAGDRRRHCVRLVNPLAEDKPLMRSNLLVTLLDTARRNVSRGMADVAVFEMGLVTCPTGSDHPVGSNSQAGSDTREPAPDLPLGQLPTPKDLARLDAALPPQPLYVAGVMAGASLDASGWWGSGRPASWADALEMVQLVARRVGVPVTVGTDAAMPWHPGRCARFDVAEDSGSESEGMDDGSQSNSASQDSAASQTAAVAFAGELHQQVCERWGLPPRTVAFEINLTALMQAADGQAVAAWPVSAFPAAKEDFAFVVDASVPAQTVEAAIVVGAGDLLEDVSLFDVFSGDQVGAGRKSLAYSVRLRAANHTLTADEVKEVRQSIVDAAQAVGAVLRG